MSRRAKAIRLIVACPSAHSAARTSQPRFPRAAVPWISRFVNEVKTATPEHVSDVADALATMEEGPDSEAAETLLAAAFQSLRPRYMPVNPFPPLKCGPSVQKRGG